MKSLFIIPVLALVLASCTVNDLDTRKNIQSNTPPVISISSGSVSLETKQTLLDAYSEEVLAHDIYTKMVEKYPNLTEVKNIINSEANHREQVGRLLDARNITRPIGYGIYSGSYEVLAKMLDSSMTGAMEAGVMIETGDIDHLLVEYKKVEDQDIRRVFENIGGGSFNHLRAFLRLAGQEKYTVITDYSRYMKSDEINSGGPLQSKMTELLKTNNLPTYGGLTMGRGNGQGNHMNENGIPENNRMMQGNGQGQGDGRGRGMNQ